MLAFNAQNVDDCTALYRLTSTVHMASNSDATLSAAIWRAAPQAVLTVGHKVEFGDFVVLLYIAAFVRQFLWLIDNQVIAWILTGALTMVLWLLHLTKKEFDDQKTPRQFWLVVALPLLLIFAMRAALPDTSFDVLNYRLVNAERGLSGWPFRDGDFFPAYYPLNPAPDMLLGIGRHLLGYRLGTITNLLVLLWVGTILEKFIRPYVGNRWLRSAGVLLILWTEHALFLVNNYMVDLLAIPLLLLATQIALQPDRSENTHGSGIRLGLYLGASIALKLLNLAYCIPIILIYFYALWRRKPVNLRLARAASWLAIGAALPLLPYSVYIWRDTGNPVFPFYNRIFHSPFWPYSNLGDERWGPHGWWETIIWPLRVTLKPERFGELAVYSGRISIVFIVAILVLAWPNLDRRLRLLGFVAFSGTLLWAAMLTGYARYAVFVEMLGGVTVLGLAASLFATNKQQTQSARLLKAGLANLLLCALLAQCLAAIPYIARNEWSMRPTFFQDPIGYRQEARYILRDYDLAKFLMPAERQPLTNVGMWIESGMLTSGVQSLLTSHAPILCAYVDNYFDGAPGRDRFASALRRGGNQRIASLCLESELNSCRNKLARWKFEIVDTLPVQIPMYSGRRKLKMVLLTLSLAPHGESQTLPR